MCVNDVTKVTILKFKAKVKITNVVTEAKAKAEDYRCHTHRQVRYTEWLSLLPSMALFGYFVQCSLIQSHLSHLSFPPYLLHLSNKALNFETFVITTIIIITTTTIVIIHFVQAEPTVW